MKQREEAKNANRYIRGAVLASPGVAMALQLLHKPGTIRSFNLTSNKIQFYESARKTKGGQEEFAALMASQSCGQ